MTGSTIEAYDLDLFRRLQAEYREKPLVPVARGLDGASLTEQARKRLRLLEQKLPLRGMRVLEVGCGKGHVLRVLKDEYECDVTGVDVVHYTEWLERPDVATFVHDIATGDNDSLGTFDRILSFAVWEHIEHPFAALRATRQLLRPEGLMFLFANLYRGPKASHRYREVYFPWPHLLFQDDVVARYYVEDLGRDPSRPSWVNKLTAAHYLTYLDELDFDVRDLSWSITPIDQPFYERFEDVLGRYPRYDLERDFINAVVGPGRQDPAVRIAQLERRLAAAEADNELLRRRVAGLTDPAARATAQVPTGG